MKCGKSLKVWPIYGSQEVVKNLSFSSNSQSVAISTISVGQFVPQCPPPLTRLWKMVLPHVLHCCFVHRHARQILKTYSVSSLPDGSNENNFSSLGLFWAEKLFEDAERIHEEHFVARNRRKLAETTRIIFSTLDNNCSAQDRHRELKLVSLELCSCEFFKY